MSPSSLGPRSAFAFAAALVASVAQAGFGDLKNAVSGAAKAVANGSKDSSLGSSESPAAKPAKVGKTFASLPTGMKNPKLEKEMIALVNKHAKPKDGSAVAAKIADRDWLIERNERTGVVQSRVLQANVLFKHSDGRCTYGTKVFGQEHDGSKYQDTLYYEAGWWSPPNSVDCE